MAVKIFEVIKGSPADKAGLGAGEILCAINENPIDDVLDYEFYAAETVLQIEIESADGRKRRVKIKKGEYEDLGLAFESYLIDKERHCKNKCVFCFVDQLPKGLRESLYFKDDDARLSFLLGNYITFTNMKQSEIDRIIKMHISPINVSVHTMNPALRVQMMGNPAAGESLKYLYQLAQAGIGLNTQLVLCPGLNDRDELAFSLQELYKLTPALQSVAAVPVGLSRHRDGLYPLRPYTRQEACAIIKMIEDFGQRCLDETGTRLVYPSDEFYLRAGKSLPPDEFYEDYPQLENGVGLMTLFAREVDDALEDLPQSGEKRTVSIATGVDAAPFMREQAAKVTEKYPELTCTVYPVINHFFGESITVAGLLTGQDLAAELTGKDLGEVLFLPEVMLRHEKDLFLDGMSIQELQTKLGTKIQVLPVDGQDFVSALAGTNTAPMR